MVDEVRFNYWNMLRERSWIGDNYDKLRGCALEFKMYGYIVKCQSDIMSVNYPLSKANGLPASQTS